MRVTLHGRRQPAHAVLVDDPDSVAAVYSDMISKLGLKRARRRLGLRINLDRSPTLDELHDAIMRSGLSIVQIHPETG